MGRRYDAYLHLLDRQVVDTDDRLVCKVDDLELVRGEEGDLFVSAILVGPAALGPRVGGRTGRAMVAVHRRLTSDAGPGRIDFSRVIDIGTAITVAGSASDPGSEELGVQGLETWARTQIIAKIPGATDDPE